MPASTILVCRDDDACRMKVSHIKPNTIAPENVPLPFPLSDFGTSLECVSNLFSTHLMASSLMRASTSETASPHVVIAKGKREEVPENEPRYLFFFRLTASARCFLYGVLHYQNWTWHYD